MFESVCNNVAPPCTYPILAIPPHVPIPSGHSLDEGGDAFSIFM